jgi:hypothetical protein
MSNVVFQENQELSFHNQPFGSQASLYNARLKLQDGPMTEVERLESPKKLPCIPAR